MPGRGGQGHPGVFGDPGRQPCDADEVQAAPEIVEAGLCHRSGLRPGTQRVDMEVSGRAIIGYSRAGRR